jgi:hypothetical protein
MKKLIKKTYPFRHIILGVLVVGLVVSSVYAFNYQPETNNDGKDKLNPRTSSIAFKKAEDQDKNRQPTKNDADKNKESNEQNNRRAKTVIVKKIVAQQNNVRSKTNAKTDRQIEETETVKIIIASGPMAGSYKIEIEDQLSGLEAMKKAQELYGLTYEYQSSSFGVYITSIGGLEAGNREYWSLEYNGSYAQVGIADLILTDEDTITWKLANY